MDVITQTNLDGLELVNRGKVRDVYAVDDDTLLIVASDRLSAFDSVLPTGIPYKGAVLTALTGFWVRMFRKITPTHLITVNVDEMPASVQAHAGVVRGRSMYVKKVEIQPIECVVRGYLAGSGWASYRENGTVCGIKLPGGLVESDELPEPIFTPATKAESGHDENVDFETVCGVVGEDIATQLRDRSLTLYRTARDYARTRGIIICDTKFEWGIADGELMLADEALTPDSSRFWPADEYEPGRSQSSFDKQYVRDYLNEIGWNHEPPAPPLPDDIRSKTTDKYCQAYELLTGKSLR